jgi:WD40 repeat protein
VADLFVSYARTDSAFVRRLQEALTELGKDVWVDWQDIPPTADWLAEVEAGIEGAGAFVFVLTPDSLASDVCATELAHAARHNKRVIPVLRRDVDGSAVPAALSRPNWVLLRAEDDERQAIETLVTALDTDLEWVEAHTRLLVRAIEWDAGDRDGSLLLRGSDLRAAEERLARPPGEPQPTDLQGEYVLASRAAATRRQRVILGGVTVALVVAVVLGLLALWQRGRAITERDTARSRELTAQSVARLSVDPEESVELALQALEQRPTAEAEEALSEALIRSRVQAALPTRGGRMAGFSQDGRLVLTLGDDGRARLWRWRADAEAPARTLGSGKTSTTAAALSESGALVATGDDRVTRIWSTATGKVLGRVPTGAPVSHAAFSRDGLSLLTLSEEGTARVWDTAGGGATPPMPAGAARAALSADGGVVLGWGAGAAVAWDGRDGRRLRRMGGEVSAGNLSPNGSLAVTAGPDGAGRVWDTRRATRPVVLRGHRGQVTSAEFSADGGLVLTAGIDGTARVWSPRTGAPLRILRGGAGPIVAATFSADGARIVTAGDDGVARVWDSRTGDLRAVLAGTGGNIVAAASSATGALVATQGYDGVVRVWDAQRGASREELVGHTAPVVGVAFTLGGGRVLTAGFDGTARIWRGERATATLGGHDGAVQSAVFSPRGDVAATAGWDGTVRLWPTDGGPPIAVLRGHRGIVYAVAFRPDGRRMVTAGADGTARVWDIASGRQLLVLRVSGRRPVVAAEYDATGARIITAGGGGIARIWDARTGRVLLALEGHTDTVVAARFSADGARAATAGLDGTARLWDARRRSTAVVLSVPPQAVDVAVSPDGSSVATAGQDGTARTWNARTGALEHVLGGHTGPVVAVRFSPDGTMIASASEDGTSRVWGARSGRRLELFTGATAALVALAFSPDGRRVATSGIDGVARVYSCDRCEAMEDPVQVAERRAAPG